MRTQPIGYADRERHWRQNASSVYSREGVHETMTTPTAVSIESTTATLIAQLRTVLDLTHTEIQVAETRVAQARTEAVRRELTQNAENGRTRAIAIEKGGSYKGTYHVLYGVLKKIEW